MIQSFQLSSVFLGSIMCYAHQQCFLFGFKFRKRKETVGEWLVRHRKGILISHGAESQLDNIRDLRF